MRLDLFLKNARLIKSRSRARDLALGAEVRVNGHPAKPAREVRAGDVVELTVGEDRVVRIEVLGEPSRPVAKGAEPLYYRTLP
jgi:ribosome-associated heat shock protein Hsp15